MEQKFNLQVPIVLTERENGFSLLVGEKESFYDYSETPSDEPLFIHGEEAGSFIVEAIREDVEALIAEALTEETGQFTITVDLRKDRENDD